MSWLRKFDVHVKAVDGVTQQTILGSVITIISFLLVAVLLVSEFRLYATTNVVSRMVADTNAGIEAIRLDFDVEFYEVSCERIKFLQEVTRGNFHAHEPDQIFKDPAGRGEGGMQGGCLVHGSIVTDKVSGNFRFSVEPDTNPNNNKLLSISEMEAQQRLAAERQGLPPGIFINNLFQQPAASIPPLSHKINRIMFLPLDKDGKTTVQDEAMVKKKVPNMEHPLNGQVTEMPNGMGLHQYAIQVVPTHYDTIRGKRLHVNQYSVTERQVETVLLLQGGGVTLSGQQFSNFFGLVFTYDFYPVMLVMEERKENIVEFLANLCGIVGGVITVLSLLGLCISNSHKAIIGKKD